VSALASSFLTYLWHYLVARLIYDHLGVVLIALAAVVLLSARRRR
jgi:hypothetical protein